MTMKDRPNRDALQRAVDIFRDTMRPFIVRNMKNVPRMGLEDALRTSLLEKRADDFVQNLRRGKSAAESIDVNDFPHIVQRNWREVFDRAFGGWRTAPNALWQIVDARNHVAHPGQQDLEPEYVRTHLYHIADILGRINAPDEKRAVEEIRDDLFAPVEASTVEASEPRGGEGGAAAELSHGQERADDAERPAPAPRPRARTAANLKAWRNVVQPSDDVAHGTFRQAEFMADLQQVYDGRADASEYGNPVKFFDQTHVTPGIRALLVNTLRRLGGKGGDPVIQAKTGFGGGKTHSLIALYHLVSNADTLLNPSPNASGRVESEIRAIMEEAGWEGGAAVQAKVAVLVGTFRATTDSTLTPNGDPLNTLWGGMAHQLGGQPAYDIIGRAAREGTAPGGAQLDALFEHVGPCVILMDELVAYVRNAGAATDAIYTFLQALTESVRRTRSAVLVVTLPDSSVEAGGEAGEEALSRLERLMGRVEAVWEPLETREAFEVVRRRLFGSEIDELEKERTCEAFSKMYASSRSHYPKEVREQRYLELMKNCYPVHPEIFERLNSDWSSIPGFQRTRGVLRMMAVCISRLYQTRDPAPLILPGNLTLSDPALADEFVKLLGEQWRPVLGEIDRDGSRTDNLDRSSSRFGEVGGAAKRVARAIFLGSAPSGAVRGINDSSIHLGVVEPGQGAAVYREALEQMRGSLYYLYEDEFRRYFHAEENLNKVAADRSAALSESELDARIVDELREASRRQSDVIVCPERSDEVLDLDVARLIVLPPADARPSRSSENDYAEARALCILNDRGGVPRHRRNTLLFLAANSDDVRGLRTSVRAYLAWDSILNGDRRIENLAGERRKDAMSSLNKAEREMRAALTKAYRWVMAPVQDDPQNAEEYRMSDWQTNAVATGEITTEAFSKCVEEEALVEEISPSALASVLERYVWKEKGSDPVDHVGIDALWDMMTSYVYMPRLRNKAVLMRCVERGVAGAAFGYADAYDDGKYTGLRFGDLADGALRIQERGGLLVNPNMARLLDEEGEKEPEPDAETKRGDGGEEGDGAGEGGRKTSTKKPRGPSRIVASKTASGDLSLDELNQLREEIIRTLLDAGGEVEVNIVISGSKRGGFSENIARSIRENGVQLGLDIDIEQGEM